MPSGLQADSGVRALNPGNGGMSVPAYYNLQRACSRATFRCGLTGAFTSRPLSALTRRPY